MQTQKTKAVIPRQLSEQELINYFFPRSYPFWMPVAFIGGGILIVIGLLLSNIIVIGFGMLLSFSSGFVIYRTKRSNPDDAQYDAWVENQAQLLYKRGLQALGITKSSVKERALRIHSYVLPGSLDAEEYVSEHVWMKHGKDGRWRFSINVYTYIYPLAQSLAIFKSDVNAFYSVLHNDTSEVYAYRHIINATTSVLNDTILLEGQKFPYRTEHFCLKITNGETVKLSAAVRAKPPGSIPGVPPIVLPEANFNRILNRLRQLLLP